MRLIIITTGLLTLLIASADAQPGSNGRFCLNERYAGERVNCSFQTKASCEQSKTSPQDTCTPNPAATTGYGVRGKESSSRRVKLLRLMPDNGGWTRADCDPRGMTDHFELRETFFEFACWGK